MRNQKISTSSPMKILASSDETGTIKEIICPRGTDTSKKDGIKPISVEKVCLEPKPSSKSKVIDMTVVDDYLITLRITGDLCIYNLENFELLKEVHLSDDKPVSLVNYGHLNSVIVAFETNVIYVVELENFKFKQVQLPVHDEDKGKVISTFVSNDFKDGLFAYGGEEYDIKIISLYKKPNTSSFLKTDFQPEFVFVAENVENDFLDLRVPISNKHIRFFEENRFIAVTKYGQLRIYDTTESKQPIHDFKIGPKPIIQAVLQEDNVILSDTTSLICKYSLTKIDPNATRINSASAGELRRPSVKALGKFSEGGNTGATPALYNFEDKYLASGGLDRYVRVFDINTRKLVAKVYVGTQISSIILVSDEPEETELEAPDSKSSKLSKKKRVNKEVEDDGEDEEDMWNELENNSVPKKIIKKKTRRI